MVPLCFIFDASVNGIVFLILIFSYSLRVHRITLDLCTVILNPETSIKSLFNPRDFMYILMISLNMHRLVSCQSLQSCFIWISAHFSLGLSFRFYSLGSPQTLYFCSLISVRMPGSVWLLPPCTKSGNCLLAESLHDVRAHLIFCQNHSPTLSRVWKFYSCFLLVLFFKYTQHKSNSGPSYSLGDRIELKDGYLRMYYAYLNKERLGNLFG